MHALQAMNLISIAQQSGDVSTELYLKYSQEGLIEPPTMAGVEQLVAKLKQETQNPFMADNGHADRGYPEAAGGRPPALGIPAGPSPRSSQVRHTHS